MFPTDDEVEDLLQHMDSDGEGNIELEEFLKHMEEEVDRGRVLNNGRQTLFQLHLRRSVDPEHDFKEAFRVFDKDGK